jgi:hypothetical protein
VAHYRGLSVVTVTVRNEITNLGKHEPQIYSCTGLEWTSNTADNL